MRLQYTPVYIKAAPPPWNGKRGFAAPMRSYATAEQAARGRCQPPSSGSCSTIACAEARLG